jgi:hypothetical protein
MALAGAVEIEAFWVKRARQENWAGIGLAPYLLSNLCLLVAFVGEEGS